ncbi:hypothetical protein JVU11DRAFT_2291 [Chiua virens]|nr:hypothetical protein JVU11DRAFT_2291 [Chiua virens]
MDPNTLVDPLAQHIRQEVLMAADLTGSSSSQYSDMSTYNSVSFPQWHRDPSDPPRFPHSQSQQDFPRSNLPLSYSQPTFSPPNSYSASESSTSVHPTTPSYAQSSLASYTEPSSSSYSDLSYPQPPPPIVPPSIQRFQPFQFEQPHPYSTSCTLRLSDQVTPAVQFAGQARAAPYTIPGLRYVPAYAPLRPNEEVRGGVVTAGVFRAGTETSVTNVPPPIRRLPPLVEPPPVSTVNANNPMPSVPATNVTVASVSQTDRQRIQARSRDEFSVGRQT